MTPTADTVLRLLRQLSVDELQAVRKQTSALLSVSSARSLDSTDDWLLDGLLTALAKGSDWRKSFPPIAQLERSYRAQVESVRLFQEVVEERSRMLSRTRKIHLGQLIGKVVVSDLEQWTSLSLPSLFKNVHRIPECLDRAFPGYLEAGMLSMLVQSK